ncbi:MAG TPA: hypothetical protein VF503_32750 [Sphingobium sp.]|uniref:DUF6925 family protein n=1 Tax=Sphingobium sp. TaxID=1912891 RepID=UPI002ED2825C
MKEVTFDLLAGLAANPASGWSIGSFGAIGEFVRDEDEAASILREPGRMEVVTTRGAMRIAPTQPLTAIAWDSLSADGESWGHVLAFCCAAPPTPHRVIRALGADRGAIRPDDQTHQLFDLGVGSGIVTMALRTGDEELISLLTAREGQPLLTAQGVMAQVLRAQPHRVLLSPAGRVEVYQPIPPADGKSPTGPHTHLLAKLVVKDRPHSSNVPIPEGMQSALSLHPRSPWRTTLGERHAFRPEIDEEFAPFLSRFGIPEDHQVETQIRSAIVSGATPEFAGWPVTRRGRIKGRITLRRLAAAGDERVKPWRIFYDRAPVNVEEGEEG